ALLIPGAMAALVLLYDIYWTAQALYSALAGLISYRRMQRSVAIDWRSRYAADGRVVQQVVVIPNYGERPETLSATLESLVQSDYPNDQLSVVLAMEEREEGALAKAEQLRAAFVDRFRNFWVTTHPLMPDETAGKGANLSHALRQVKTQCDRLGWDPSLVM